MSERIAVQLGIAFRGSIESLRLAFNKIASKEVDLESSDATETVLADALVGLDTFGLAILVECQDGQHWVFACPWSDVLPFSAALSTNQLQAMLDAVREAVCATIPVVATHVLLSKNIGETVRRGALSADIDVVTLRVKGAKEESACRLLGPLPMAQSLLPIRRPTVPKPYNTLEDGLEQLPSYARSLLKVQVPISVTLASTKKPVSAIVSLGPGAIIQFKKACDETLSLEVGGLRVAEGEAVKVGEKFGLWITEITLPSERFRRVQDLL